MNRKTVVGLTQYLALVGPGTRSLVGCGVGPMLRNATGGILQVVLAVALVDP